MDAVQRLRVKAQKNNKLVTNQQQKVTTQTVTRPATGGGAAVTQQVIEIEPAFPTRITCPITIRPSSTAAGIILTIPPITGQRRPTSPAASSRPASRSAPAMRSAAGRPAVIRGGGCNWGGNTINVNRNVINNGRIAVGNGNAWQHNPVHRQGVRYNNADVANKYGGGNRVGNGTNRNDFRGRGGGQVLKPGAGAANRPNVARRQSGAANRPNAGAGNRPNAGNVTRPNGGGQSRPNGGGNRPNGKPGNRPSGGPPAIAPAAVRAPVRPVAR